MPASPLLSVPLAVVLLALGVPALLAGVRGLRGTLPQGSALGVRGPAAQASEQAGRVANRVAGPVVLASGAVLLIGAVVTVALRLPTVTTVVLFVVALVGGVVLLAVGGSLGERAAMLVPRPATKPVGCSGCACGAGGCGGAAAVDSADDQVGGTTVSPGAAL